MSNPAVGGGAAEIHALFEKRASSQYGTIGPVPQPLSSEPWTGAVLYRIQRNTAHLCALGVRPTYELLREIAAAHGLADNIEQLLARYARLDSDLIDAVGGRTFPPVPLHEVPPR